MIKKIFFRIVIMLFIASASYGIFWFFKVGQVEKQIDRFVSENSSFISVGNISSSGFPLMQKITISDLKFTIPNSVLDGRQVVIKNLTAQAEILSSDFSVTIPEKVTLQDNENNIFTVEFAKDPTIAMAIANDEIVKFNYNDFGYRILDEKGNIIYAAGSTSFNYSSAIDEMEEITSKISVKVKDIENFDVLDIYKNAVEEKIINNIKTGELVLGNIDGSFDSDNSSSSIKESVVAVDNGKKESVAKAAKEAVAKVKEAVDIAKKTEIVATKEASPKIEGKKVNNDNKVAENNPPVAVVTHTKPSNAADLASEEKSQEAVEKPIIAEGAVTEDAANIADNNIENNVEKVSLEDLETVVNNSDIIKSNFSFEIEYILTPVSVADNLSEASKASVQDSSDNHAPIPNASSAVVDDLPLRYSRSVKITSLEFSNPLYKIFIDGELNIYNDDNKPSGFVTLKVEKPDVLVNYMVNGFENIVKDRSGVTVENIGVTTSDLADNGSSVDDSYLKFLEQFSAGLPAVSKELAIKNSASNDNISEYKIRREKNLEFLINETSMREILGKF